MRDIVLGQIIYPKFTTRAFSTGTPATLAGTPSVAIYEEDNLVAIVAGVTLTTDWAGLTGVNQVAIDTALANGYEIGKSYDLVITAGTVDGVSVVGEVVFSFTIQASAAFKVATLLGSTASGGRTFEIQSDITGTTIKGVTPVGVQTGTFANTEADDANYHSIAGVGGAIDWVYVADVGGNRTVSEFSYRGYLNSGNDDITVQMYNLVGLVWETRGVISGQNGDTDTPRTFTALGKHTGTAGADLGLCYIRFVCTGQTNPTLNINELGAVGVAESLSAGYANGAVWVDTAEGEPGTEINVNGVVDNPVDLLTSAITIAEQKNLHIIHVTPDSIITLVQPIDDYQFAGRGYLLDLGGQSCENAHIQGATLSGTGTIVAGEMHLDGCEVGNSTLGSFHMLLCGLTGTVRLGSSGDYKMIDCYTETIGIPAPIIDMHTSVGARQLFIHRYAGSITLDSLALGDVVELTGTFDTVILNGTAATVSIVGIAGEVINNLIVKDNVTDSTVRPSDIVNILVDTDDLQSNQGNWLTATGFATETQQDTINGVVDNILLDTDELITNQGNWLTATGFATEAKQDAQNLIITEERLSELDPANLPAGVDGVPTLAQLEARTPTPEQLAYIVSNSADGLPCTFTGGTTTTAILGNVDGLPASLSNDVYNGRILVFNAGTLNQQVTDITAYDGATRTATITAVTLPVTSSHTANMK